MSGAFNIDVEVGPAPSKGALKIWCASLTETWIAEQHVREVNIFRQQLLNDEHVRKHKIAVPDFDPKDLASCEDFLSQLGCTAAVLRVGAFQNFLNIPQHVREGLNYASHKPFGKTTKEGFLQKHPRFVRKNVGKRWIRLTRDERGGSLVSYSDETKKTVLASFKIGASTELKNITASVKNAFVVKSGKRQWVLQSSSTRDFDSWQSAILEILKQFGNASIAKLKNTTAKPKVEAEAALGGAEANKLQTQIAELQDRIEQLTGRNDNLRLRVQELQEDELKEDDEDVDALRRKIQNEFNHEKENIIRDYELEHENLRLEIEELHRAIEAKTATDGGHSALRTMFAEGFQKVKADDEIDSDIEMEKEYLEAKAEEDGDDEERHSMRFTHQHLHRHDHKHIHHHRHVHIHDDTQDPAVRTSETHTITHTITHTNTQFKIKKGFF